jgi:nuclease S1
MTSRAKGSHAGFLRMLLAVGFTLFLLWPCSVVLGWGYEGHEIIALIAERYMTKSALSTASRLIDGATIDEVASWAISYRRDHPETGPWHYINIPLADSQIDTAHECSGGNCVIGKTEQFLAVLRDPRASHQEKAEALEFVVHFVGDLHQPLHDEDDGDVGGNLRHVIFDGRRDNLHWIWDTGLLRDINQNPRAFAAELESHITNEERKEWESGSIEDWALDAHRIARRVAYGDLSKGHPAVITLMYRHEADPVIELQLEKAGVRLAYVLNRALQ